MSTQNFLRSSAIGAICIAGLSISVSANAQGSRYGGSVYDYEGGQNCQVAPCQAAHSQTTSSSRYGGQYVETMPAAPVYVDCQTTFGPQCGAPVVQQPTTVYTQPQPMYSQQPTYTQQAQTYDPQPYDSQQEVEIYAQPSYQAAPVNCPAGTTAQSDGTCMQTSDSYSTYGSTSTYSSGSTATYGGVSVPPVQSYSESYSAPSYNAGPPANCPSGTTAQSDGTCMQTGDSYSSGSYTGSSSSSSYSTGSVEMYSGDAAPSTSYGYTSDGTYTAKDYMPIRK